MKNPLIMMWQIITYFIVGLPLRLLYNTRAHLEFTVEERTSYILCSNHPKRVDPFILSYSLPFKVFVQLVPFRFITAQEYLRNPILEVFLRLYGCISTHPKRSTVTRNAAHLLKKEETLVIFPSGFLQDIPKKPKVGMIRIHQLYSESALIPVAITYANHWTDKTLIHYKKPRIYSSFPKDLQPLANQVWNDIKK